MFLFILDIDIANLNQNEDLSCPVYSVAPMCQFRIDLESDISYKGFII